ncbi:MAG: fold metallo-hydrolase [Aeromicrobium sp.]|jgi:glyoxylase-like metal-dependent hydrolase (beta-lactamase superfamily II)|uniref:MBL fold metallo-hydrolase n=1 Tax=Aeromicrobium sp. TaxID=1871063 RepID=UPI002615F7F7|nr:MBL fold metallo-hydrolase [Aeromicrobium sp.]MCW2789646.1 fold metallo-hydrolase [Aeromicrobium sp.]MCW2823436.1 fold metallo-hydrolase [Aeromicrobium sp.]
MRQSVTDRATTVLAENPGIMTLDGTNTWILREPGASRSVVVDPGPDDERHIQAVLAAAGEVGLVLFTHRHFDHTEALSRIVELTGAPARSIDPEFTRGAEPLVDGETIDVDGLAIEVLATPGHTTDSTCFLVGAERTLLSGDTILGRGTTVIAHPDGVLGPYLDSLAHIRELIEEGLVERILPGHGPVITDPGAVVDFYLEHRAERLDQVRAAVEAGASTPREVVETVYADVDESLWGAAELSVAAQLDYLR